MRKLFKNICLTAATAALLTNTFAFTACGGHVHTPDDVIIQNEVKATCTSDGSYEEVIYCIDCDEEISRTKKSTPKTGHTPAAAVKENEVPSTCTIKGSYEEVEYCKDCKEELTRTRKDTDLAEHTPEEAVKENEVPSTCSKEGTYEEVIYCGECDAEISRTSKTIEKIPHVYSDAYSSDNTGHWYQCVNCTDKKDFKAHNPGPAATETTSQVCLDCSYVIASPIGHVHANLLTPVSAVSATCLTEGNIAYYTCTCGKWYSDDKANNEIENHDTVFIRPTGHSFAEGWSSDDTHHWHAATCEHSEKTTGNAEHNWDNGVVSGNQKTYTCRVCARTKVTAMYIVSFNYNYEGSPAAITVKIEDGNTVAEPNAISRNGYTFTGWYTDAGCTTVYSFDSIIRKDTNVYAGWEKSKFSETILEAEYTNLRGKKGVGYSSETTGVGMIQSDEGGAAKASNGYFVGYMYRNNNSLSFVFESSEETDQATIKLRLSGEVIPIIRLSDSEFEVRVNGNKLSFDDIVISGIDPDMSKTTKREFQDFTVGIGVHLNKGVNEITLTVNNFNVMAANMRSTAPLIDCVKITSDTDITYEPILENLNRFKD